MGRLTGRYDATSSIEVRRQKSPKEFRYGDGNTIHKTHYLDVEVDSKGNVLAVWFRCLLLPFAAHKVHKERADDLRKIEKESLPHIKAIVCESRENESS